jgi:hypothetical protein
MLLKGFLGDIPDSDLLDEEDRRKIHAFNSYKNNIRSTNFMHKFKTYGMTH